MAIVRNFKKKKVNATHISYENRQKLVELHYEIKEETQLQVPIATLVDICIDAMKSDDIKKAYFGYMIEKLSKKK